MFMNILLSFVAAVLAGIPTWLFLLARFMLDPDGFWQKFVVYGAGIYFLVPVQLLLFFMLCAALWVIWSGNGSTTVMRKKRR